MSQTTANLGTTATILSRVVGVTQALVTVASVGTLTRRIFNVSTEPPTIVEADTELVIEDVIFDVPQTDEGWGNSSAGYNFKDRFLCSEEGELEVVYTFTDTSDGSNPVVDTHLILVANVPADS